MTDLYAPEYVGLARGSFYAKLYVLSMNPYAAIGSILSFAAFIIFVQRQERLDCLRGLLRVVKTMQRVAASVYVLVAVYFIGSYVRMLLTFNWPMMDDPSNRRVMWLFYLTRYVYALDNIFFAVRHHAHTAYVDFHHVGMCAVLYALFHSNALWFEFAFMGVANVMHAIVYPGYIYSVLRGRRCPLVPWAWTIEFYLLWGLVLLGSAYQAVHFREFSVEANAAITLLLAFSFALTAFMWGEVVRGRRSPLNLILTAQEQWPAET